MSEDQEIAAEEHFDAEAISARLRALTERPIGEHPAIFEGIHQQLQSALQDLDSV